MYFWIGNLYFRVVLYKDYVVLCILYRDSMVLCIFVYGIGGFVRLASNFDVFM